MIIIGLLVGFVLGAVLGSLAKVLADRSLNNGSFLGRSYCLRCKHTLSWHDLFPIFSFILLRGKCRYCRKLISLEYLIVEVVMGIIVGFIFYQSNFQFQISNFQSIFNFQFLNFLFNLIFQIFFVTILAILFLTDLKEMFIPDRIVIPGIYISIILLIILTITKIIYLYQYLSRDPVGKYLLPPHSEYFTRHVLVASQPFFGAILVGLGIAGFFGLLVAITRGKGMGGGDIKLGLLMGLGLGFPGGIIAVILAFMSGAVVALLAVAAGRKALKSQIPFGPFLIFGSLVVLFWGRELLDFYIKIGT